MSSYLGFLNCKYKVVSLGEPTCTQVRLQYFSNTRGHFLVLPGRHNARMFLALRRLARSCAVLLRQAKTTKTRPLELWRHLIYGRTCIVWCVLEFLLYSVNLPFRITFKSKSFTLIHYVSILTL